MTTLQKSKLKLEGNLLLCAIPTDKNLLLSSNKTYFWNFQKGFWQFEIATGRINFRPNHMFLVYLWNNSNPNWSPRDNQRWTALFQRFDVFQRCLALIQRTRKMPALMSVVSNLISSDFLWISAVQNWNVQRSFRKNQLRMSVVQRWFS